MNPANNTRNRPVLNSRGLAASNLMTSVSLSQSIFSLSKNSDTVAELIMIGYNGFLSLATHYQTPFCPKRVFNNKS